MNFANVLWISKLLSLSRNWQAILFFFVLLFKIFLIFWWICQSSAELQIFTSSWNCSWTGIMPLLEPCWRALTLLANSLLLAHIWSRILSCTSVALNCSLWNPNEMCHSSGGHCVIECTPLHATAWILLVISNDCDNQFM